MCVQRSNATSKTTLTSQRRFPGASSATFIHLLGIQSRFTPITLTETLYDSTDKHRSSYTSVTHTLWPAFEVTHFQLVFHCVALLSLIFLRELNPEPGASGTKQFILQRWLLLNCDGGKPFFTGSYTMKLFEHCEKQEIRLPEDFLQHVDFYRKSYSLMLGSNEYCLLLPPGSDIQVGGLLHMPWADPQGSTIRMKVFHCVTCHRECPGDDKS